MCSRLFRMSMRFGFSAMHARADPDGAPPAGGHSDLQKARPP
jgi:hypothetical protein